MNRAFFVVGPESSGTRLMTKILMCCGCRGTDSDWQAFDSGFTCDGGHIVYRRSIPHSKVWPNLKTTVTHMEIAGFMPYLVVMTRDWLAMMKSQIARGHVLNQRQADENIRDAYAEIFSTANTVSGKWCMISYEALVTNKNYMDEMVSMLGLIQESEFPAFKNMNSKHYALRTGERK